ncbi:hypothetical protein V6N13_003165 [Hibiscus sabdariffa]|uniref:Uncharacterized protein n=1 Tax=Hibiscus sabdariffa TaxID=183260 RepID=A0ABR2NDU4_9ROSI
MPLASRSPTPIRLWKMSKPRTQTLEPCLLLPVHEVLLTALYDKNSLNAKWTLLIRSRKKKTFITNEAFDMEAAADVGISNAAALNMSVQRLNNEDTVTELPIFMSPRAK